jgi:hypothetical protein
LKWARPASVIFLHFKFKDCKEARLVRWARPASVMFLHPLKFKDCKEGRLVR